MGIDEIIKKCEHLYNDLDFGYVKAWKEKTGGKAIGYMPVYIPQEIIHAAGALPVGIMGGGSNLEIIKGDAYFQSYICHIPRSTIEMGISGKLDVMDGMIFPAICDVIRNLSGMWQMLFKNKYVKYLDLPQNFDPEIGGAFYRYEIEDILSHVSQITGKKVSPEDLKHSITLYNENRKAIKSLYDLRAEVPHKIPTSEVYLLLRAGNILEVTEHTALMAQYMTEVKKRDIKPQDNIKVAINGAFCEQPPLGLIKALESSGCYIVEDDWVLGVRYIQEPVATNKDPISGLVDAYLTKSVSTASKYEDKKEKGEYLINSVKETGAEGVIFCMPSFCDPALLERPMLAAALTKAGISYTSFKYAENTGQFRTFKEQTGTFADSIKLWGGV